MKIEVRSPVPEADPPDVGDIWRHPGDHNLFLRIDDAYGARAHRTPEDPCVIYSVCLDSPDLLVGTVYTTHLLAEFEILQPIGGTLLLEPVA
jgi:hypothetical protein